MKKISKFILSLLLFMIVIPLSGNIPEENTIGDQIVLVRKENDGDSVLRSPEYFPFNVRLKDHTIYVYDNIGGLSIFVNIYNSTIEQDFWLSGKDCESIQLPLEWSGSFCIELSVEGKLFVGAFSL